MRNKSSSFVIYVITFSRRFPICNINIILHCELPVRIMKFNDDENGCDDDDEDDDIMCVCIYM